MTTSTPSALSSDVYRRELLSCDECDFASRDPSGGLDEPQADADSSSAAEQHEGRPEVTHRVVRRDGDAYKPALAEVGTRAKADLLTKLACDSARRIWRLSAAFPEAAKHLLSMDERAVEQRVSERRHPRDFLLARLNLCSSN